MNNTQRVRAFILAAAFLCSGAAQGQDYNLRGYGAFTQRRETRGDVEEQQLTFSCASSAQTFASKLYSDFELTAGNRIESVPTSQGAIDVIVDGAGGCLAPVCVAGGKSVVVLIARDKAALAAAAGLCAKAVPLRRTEITHPLYMDKWDRYCLGVWQGIGDYSDDPANKTPESFYKWLGQIGLNPQINLPCAAVDGAVNDNEFTWLRDYYRAYGVKFQFVQWLLNAPDLYNRNPFLSETINPHVATRWSYYGEQRLGDTAIRQAQNANYARLLRDVDADPNQMAVLDPDGEVQVANEEYWGASGPAMQREFVRFLRDVRKLSLDDVSIRYYGKHGAFASWDDVSLADYREFYGWTAGAMDLAGEWRFLRDDSFEAYTAGWPRADYDDSDWIRLYYPGDALVFSLASGPGGPLWMRKTIDVDPKKFPDHVYLSIAPLSSMSVQVFVNGRPVGSLDPGFHTALTWGQFDVTADAASSHKLMIALKFGVGDAPCGPIFLTPKKLQPYPTSDPQLNARRYDHMEFVDWAAAQAVETTLKTIRSIDPDRPIKIHAYGQSPWGWTVVAKYGGYSHHTGSGPGWSYTEPHQYAASRSLQDSSETGGPVNNLRDLKGLFGNLIFMGKNAHDYFLNLTSISSNPQMRAYFLQKMAAIKVMGRENINISPIAVIDDQLSWYCIGEFGTQESWRYLVAPARGGELNTLLDGRRIAEGNLGGFKAIVDPGAECWTEAEAAALKVYVQGGGVLVLNAMSGRSSFIKQGGGPGPALAGVRIGALAAGGREVKFDGVDPLFGALTGKLPVGLRYGEPPVVVVPDAGVTVLAKWEDGSAALTRRSIGSGAIYFYGGNIYPGQMMSALSDRFGSPVYATAKGGFDLLRTATSNNGCEDLLMLRGLGGKPATVQWTFDYTPARIYDPVTGETVPAQINGNTATFTANIDDWDFQWYASQRPSASDAFAHWLVRQTQIWSGPAHITATPSLAVYRHLDLNRGWSVVQTDTVDAAKALMSRDNQAAGLKTTELVLWSAPNTGLKAHSAALYRRVFDLPQEWRRPGVFTLAVRGQIQGAPFNGMDGHNEIFLNGVSIRAGGKVENENIDVTSRIVPSANKLEIVHEGSGIMPSIVLVRSAVPSATVDLSGEWNAVAGQNLQTPVTLPGSASAAFVYRDVVVPNSARGQEIWLRVDGAAPFVVVNGRVRYYDTWTGSSAGLNTTEIDVTPDIRFGESNRIALGASMFNGWHPAALTFNRVELAVYRPGAWSPDGKGIRDALSPKELAAVARDMSTVRLYPMIRAAVVKRPLALLPDGADMSPFQPPSPILDLDLHAVIDRSANALPVKAIGGVEPFTEAGGKIAGVYFRGESATPGRLEITSKSLRHEMDGKSFTMRVWVKPVAINQSGGTIAAWFSFLFNWTINDTSTTINLSDPPRRVLDARNVVFQRKWQCLTLTLDGRKATLYVNGVAVGVQTWNAPFSAPERPLCIGAADGRWNYFNGKLSGFTIYPVAMTATDVARLYLSEQARYAPVAGEAFPEDDLFRLSFDGDRIVDSAEIPSTLESSGAKVCRDEVGPYVALSGTSSYILAHDNPRAANYASPYSVVWEMRRDAGSKGTVFRHHHFVSLWMAADGALTFDANIGRHNNITFPGAIPAGAWVRLMLTFDGHTVRLYRDGKLIGEQSYAAAFGWNDYPISLFADRTYRFPDYGNIMCDVREYRLIPGVLDKMPEPAYGR